MKQLVIEAKIESLEEVLDFISSELDIVDCASNLKIKIVIAVEEIFVNIAHYAYNHEIGTVDIRIKIEDEVTIEFEDSGVPYNPLEVIEPDISKEAHERELGGLGVYMVKQIMDKIEYKYNDGKNILTMSKKT